MLPPREEHAESGHRRQSELPILKFRGERHQLCVICFAVNRRSFMSDNIAARVGKLAKCETAYKEHMGAVSEYEDELNGVATTFKQIREKKSAGAAADDCDAGPRVLINTLSENCVGMQQCLGTLWPTAMYTERFGRSPNKAELTTVDQGPAS